MNIAIILIIFQVHVDLWIEDHIWHETCNAISATVKNIGPDYRSALRKGRLANIGKTYPVGAQDGQAVGQGVLIVAEALICWCRLLVIELSNVQYVAMNGSRNFTLDTSIERNNKPVSNSHNFAARVCSSG